MKFSFLIFNYNVVTIYYQLCFDVGFRWWKVRVGTRKKKTEGWDKTPGGRGATIGGAKSKKRGESSREKETEGETEEASGGRETDEGRGGTAETKRGRWRLLSESGLTGGSRTGAEKKLVKEDESRTIGVSSVQGEDKSDQPPLSDKKTTGPLFFQGDCGTTPSERRNGERARNWTNRWRESLREVCQLWHFVFATRPSVSVVFFQSRIVG